MVTSLTLLILIGLSYATATTKLDRGRGNFSAWSACSAECGGGTQSRENCSDPCPDVWVDVEHDIALHTHDLGVGAPPLQIKANSTMGSGEKVVVWFKDGQGSRLDSSGGLSIRFSSPPEYYIHKCQSSYRVFPDSLKAGDDKVWTIWRTKQGLTIEYNGEIVLKSGLSDDECKEYGLKWKRYWTRNTNRIYFPSRYDTASVYWRTRQDMWVSVERDVAITRDLGVGAAPLQIKTDSVMGSEEKIVVWFREEYGSSSGGISIKFSSQPQYYLHKCHSSYRSFNHSLPADDNKVWTIVRTAEGVVVICNGKVVLITRFTDEECKEYGPQWINFWNQISDRLYFPSRFDTASDYMRTNQDETRIVVPEYNEKDIVEVVKEILPWLKLVNTATRAGIEQ